jgi:two-component system OmpR family response regulator
VAGLKVSDRPTILLVEDDERFALSVRVALEGTGWEVATIPDGVDLDAAFVQARPDLVVLDIGLPRGPDGFALARRVLELRRCPVVFLTAMDGLEDRLRGFDLGADDYVVKPVALSELVARVRVVLRGSGRVAGFVHESPDLAIDEGTGRISVGGHVVELTRTERNLLMALASEPGRVLSKLQLLALVWGFNEYDPNLVEVYVSSLRRKLGPAATLIRTERGRGYVFEQ